jgi:hypothetical protein
LQWALGENKSLQCRKGQAQLAYLPPRGHGIPREVQLLHVAVVTRAPLLVVLIPYFHITVVVEAEVQLLETVTTYLILLSHYPAICSHWVPF